MNSSDFQTRTETQEFLAGPREVLVTREQALADVLKALGQLLCATDHYGFTDKHSEEFWEAWADTAMENGQTSDDIRREVWEMARRAYNDAIQLS